MQIVLNKTQIDQKIMRLAHEILENTTEENVIFLAGICGNGLRIAAQLEAILKANTNKEIIAFEIRLNKEEPLNTAIQLSISSELIKDSFIILVDDVLNSGCTMQYALMKILETRVKAVKTVALVDRSHRKYPIKCDFVGLTLSTTLKERVEVEFQEDNYFAYLV
jgi:pyrimidine operon attenuation protein/uracil phosphoribosyltransferase